MSNLVTQEQIETVIASLPPQNRTMIRLLLLQYLDVTKDDIEYMAVDQPDSRFQSGQQPEKKISSLEGTREIAERADQYRNLLRHKRERPWLQIKCLQKLIDQTQAIIAVAEHILTTDFSLSPETLQQYRKDAPAALPKPAVRQLEKAWDKEEIGEDQYKKERLIIEYQTLIRRLIRHKRRLVTAQKEFQSAGASPLQDHEIAHIWGIPLGSLAARKVKALHQYLTDLHKEVLASQTAAGSAPSSPGAQPPDLWKETLAILNNRSVQRSIVSYGGLERTEEQLMEKLQEFAAGDLPEEAESRFWMDITKIKDTEHSGPWENHSRSIFALQKLLATQAELDFTSEEEMEIKLKAKATPKSLADALPAHETEEQPLELSEQGIGVIQAFIGEQDDKRRT